jgi:LmbE family N-acetylglucosaminyl deacetylase
MKPGPSSQPDLPPLLAFGAHPDDIEFDVGGVIAMETRAGRTVHMVVCSRGESATNGTPEQRKAESEKAAAILGATLEFIELDGDAHLEIKVEHAIKLAAILRRVKPGIVLAPSPVENQHPDHWRLARLVRDAARLARYGGMKELGDLPPHSIGQLFFYAGSATEEPSDISPILVDVSDPQILATWKAAMEAHASQARTRDYVLLQLTRADLNGRRAGAGSAIALFPSDPPIVDSLAYLERGARRF